MAQPRPQTESGFITVGDTRVVFLLARSRKRKRTIAFKMQADATLHIIAPFSASLGAITKLMQGHAPWIAKKLHHQKHAQTRCDFTDGSLFPYLGYACRLHITQGSHAPQSCRLSPHALHVHVPDATLSPQALRDETRLEIMLALKRRARVKFKKRLDLWARRLGVAYARLLVTDPDRRWGSCSADNTIRLNWRLMMAPLPILDYVVAHELCHVRHKDHSPRFWGFLEQAMPDWKQRRKVLRALEQSQTL